MGAPFCLTVNDTSSLFWSNDAFCDVCVCVCVCVSTCEREAKVMTMLCRCDLPQEYDPEVLEGASGQ